MNSRPLTNPFLGITAIALVAGIPSAAAAQPAGAVQSFEYHHGNILGTAMDLTVVASTRADADIAEAAVLAEVQRLQKILSAYEPDAELAKLNASPVGGPGLRVSPELIEVLKQYDVWSKRTRGAYDGHVGDIISLWEQAEKSNVLPGADELKAAATKAKAPAWEIDDAAKTVRRISDQQINVDSLGKGYIIDNAVAAATRSPNPLKGLLLNIGGDLRTWGQPSDKPDTLWSVGIQDPDHPELNGTPQATLFVAGNRSVSTSGAYQRFYTVDGKKYSHIIDARTGKTGLNKAATVVAADSATANALATICCAMRYSEGFEIVRTVPNTECLIIAPDGSHLRTDGFEDLQDQTLAVDKQIPQLKSAFPAGFKVSIDLETTPTQRWPYVYVWVTDSAGKHVKTLASYGDDPRYLREVREWQKIAAGDRVLRSITHATQRSGKYPLSWDGTNQKGSHVALGKYNIWVEVVSEHGPYSAKFVPIELGKEPATATIGKTNAFFDVKVSYGPGAK